LISIIVEVTEPEMPKSSLLNLDEDMIEADDEPIQEIPKQEV
jgi:hypothetical protein